MYLATDPDHGSVALKVMSTDTPTDLLARRRFAQEIEAIASIRHRNVVRLFHAGAVDGTPYAVLERVRGRSLARIGTQPWPVVVDLMRQLARAVEAVHAAGWLHRDIKRSNVMVGDHGLVTLIDFGLAKRIRDREVTQPTASPGAGQLTVRGTVVGTPRYLAPELLRGERATTATDVYSLGLTVHELLGGDVPTAGALTPIPVRVPVPLEDLLARALSSDPRRRPTATTMAALLEHLPALPGRYRTRAYDDSPTWPVTADLRPTRDDRHLGLRLAS